mgnify:CR=1 FL=1
MAKKILAVTGCPTGIAHTFMAEEALKTAAKELGVEIKVETNGAAGAENVLTPEDIRDAIGVIVASDKNEDTDRFSGLPTIITSVGDGINKPAELIQRILDGKVPVLNPGKAAAKAEAAAPAGQESLGRQIYKHLMNGVSHMLPFVVAGGVLTAISFLWGIYSFDPTSEQYNAFAAMLKNIGGISMGLMVPVFTAFIGQSIASRPGMIAGFVGGMLAANTGSGFIGGILAGFVAGYFTHWLLGLLSGLPKQYEGLKSIFLVPLVSVTFIGIFMSLTAGPVTAINEAMMNFLAGLQNSNPLVLGIVIGCMSAFDMGGPVNKAAYVTGTMLLGLGNDTFMAGVSAACITPPLVIALATTIFPKKFTDDERAAGIANYVLGCTHITEGAIPFAAKNPIVVLPILMLASSISAVLTYMMGIHVPAPHGGFLILPLVSNPIMWVVDILIGSAVGAVIYGITKKEEK